MSNKCCHRVCGQHFCVRAEAWARVGSVVLIAPCRKTVRKYYMRPQTLGEARRQRRNISRNSFFHRHVLTGRPQWAAGALVLIPLQCWDSRHQWLTHAGSWLTLAFFHPKLFLFFFFSSSSMNFLLFFPDTVCGWNSGVIVSKFPGPVQGQEPVVKE